MSDEAPEQDPHHTSEESPSLPLAPGSLDIRPTRRDAEHSEAAFYELLEWSRVHEDLSLKNLSAILNKANGQAVSTISRQITEKRLSEGSRTTILRSMFSPKSGLRSSVRQRVNDQPHALYFAFLAFLNINETSQDNARAAIEGTFQFWRRSVEHPGEITHGKLVFAEDKATRAVTVTMSQIKRGNPGVRATRSTSHGYFFRVGKHYLMMLEDRDNRDFRLTYFPGVRFAEVGVDAVDTDENAARSIFARRQRHIISLDGYVIGIDYNRCFLSPIYASLVDNVDELATLDETLDVMPADDPRVPRRVAAKLEAGGPLQILS